MCASRDYPHHCLGLLIIAASLLLLLPPMAQAKPSFKRVAVVVHAQNPTAKKLQRAAQSRLELILQDNGITVVDREESEKLKSIWTKLEDPGYFVTAEDFLENTSQANVELDGLVVAYLSADTSPALGGYFSATAHADIRFVDSQAEVSSIRSQPQGVPGRPPSDGLTKLAALINATQRSIDEAAENFGLTLMDPASPRSMRLTMTGPVDPPASAVFSNSSTPLTKQELAIAELLDKSSNHEKIRCHARAPGGELGVVGTQQFTLPRGRPFRQQGSRLHLIDLSDKRPLLIFDTQVVGDKPKAHSGSAAALGCIFVSGWRYLAAVTGDLVSLWDVERGTQLAQLQLPDGIDEAELLSSHSSAGDFILVRSGKRQWAYRIEQP
ncbi:MAG: hypothetical protein ACSHXK_06740 [Oceanococcus sp.]